MSILSTVFPVASIYKWLAIGGLVLALMVGAGIKGYSLGNAKSAAVIASYTAKRDQQDADLLGIQTQTNTKIVTQVVTQKQVIHEKEIQLVQQANSVPDVVSLSPQWLSDYNDSISPVPSTASSADGSTAGITAADAIKGIIPNNDKCLQNAEQLSDLQAWVTATQANIKKANKTKN